MAIGTPTFLVENSANGLTLTVPAGGVAVGTTVIVAAGHSGSDVITGVTDSRGNTWTVDETNATNGWAGSVASCKLTTALQASDTITVTFDGAGSIVKMVAVTVTGLSDSPVDQAISASGTSTAPDSGDATTTQADELLLGVCVFDASAIAGDEFVPGAGYTDLGEWNASGDRQVAIAYDIVSSSGTYDADGTLSSSWPWSMFLVSYKGAGAGAQGVSPSSVASEESVGSPSLLSTFTLSPGSVPSEEDVPTPSISTLVGISPASVPSEESIPTPSVVGGGLTLTPASVASEEDIPVPTLQPGQVTLSPASVGSEESIPTPSLSVGPVTVAPSSVPSEEDIPIPSVEGGDAPPVVPYHHLGLRFGLGL